MRTRALSALMIGWPPGTCAPGWSRSTRHWAPVAARRRSRRRPRPRHPASRNSQWGCCGVAGQGRGGGRPGPGWREATGAVPTRGNGAGHPMGGFGRYPEGGEEQAKYSDNRMQAFVHLFGGRVNSSTRSGSFEQCDMVAAIAFLSDAQCYRNTECIGNHLATLHT